MGPLVTNVDNLESNNKVLLLQHQSMIIKDVLTTIQFTPASES